MNFYTDTPVNIHTRFLEERNGLASDAKGVLTWVVIEFLVAFDVISLTLMMKHGIGMGIL